MSETRTSQPSCNSVLWVVGRWLRCQSWALLQDGQPEANAIPEQLVFCEDYLFTDMFSSVQLLSHVQLLVTPWTAACQASLSITNSQSLLKLMSIESVMPSYPLSFSSPPAINLSQHQGLFKWVSSSHQVARVLELQLQHQSFQWIFRTDFLRTGWISLSSRDSQESFPTHSSTTSILRSSAFFIVHLSHPYMTAGKTIALTRQTFVGKIMSLLFNMLSRLIINM